MKRQIRTICNRWQWLFLLVLITGCVSTARVSDFSKTADGLDFERLSERDYDRKDAIWNQKTGYEYFIKLERLTEDELVGGITRALKKLGYDIRYSDKQGRTIIGERGLRANEWSSVVGVYYRQTGESYYVYIRNVITQDVTGGWRDNRAQKVAQAICADLKTCVDLHQKK